MRIPAFTLTFLATTACGGADSSTAPAAGSRPAAVTPSPMPATTPDPTSAVPAPARTPSMSVDEDAPPLTATECATMVARLVVCGTDHADRDTRRWLLHELINDDESPLNERGLDAELATWRRSPKAFCRTWAGPTGPNLEIGPVRAALGTSCAALRLALGDALAREEGDGAWVPAR